MSPGLFSQNPGTWVALLFCSLLEVLYGFGGYWDRKAMGASDDLVDNGHGGNGQNEDHYVDDYDLCWFHNVDVDSGLI